MIGLGFMNGRQKLLYLPEAHKDFIYAVAGVAPFPNVFVDRPVYMKLRVTAPGVLAGSLNEQAIEKLLPLEPAYIGVRGAACAGGRDQGCNPGVGAHVKDSGGNPVRNRA